MAISDTTIQKAHKVKSVLKEYFSKHPSREPIPAKEFMPYFIKVGIFAKDSKAGLPIRSLLRTLDDEGLLKLIPQVIAERKDKNTNWYFAPMSSSNIVISKTSHRTVTKQPKVHQPKNTSSKVTSDEQYVLDLCDEILGTAGSRQYTFDFLRGDPGKSGLGKKLPVDAYYPSLNLVIEYKEKQHTEPVKFFDSRETVSGVGRGEQRKIYDQRRRDLLPANGIKLIEISYTSFNLNSSKRIIRDPVNDRNIIKSLLKDYLK